MLQYYRLHFFFDHCCSQQFTVILVISPPLLFDVALGEVRLSPIVTWSEGYLPWDLGFNQVGLILRSERFLSWRLTWRGVIDAKIFIGKICFPLIDLGGENEVLRVLRF